jgi:hypothetical protein
MKYLPAWAHRLAALVCLSMLLAPAVAGDDAPGAWRLSVRSDHHSDAVALRDLNDDAGQHLAPRGERSLAWVDDELRASRDAGAWTWSLLARSRATLVASRGALDLVSQVEGVHPADANRHWETDARMRGFSGAGIELSRHFRPASGWRARVDAQVLVLRHWRERHIAGTVDYEAASATYAVDLQSSQLDDRLDFPFRSRFASRGSALLLGGELAWQSGPWSSSITLRDLGWLRWRGVPQRNATLATATQSYDADGFVIYKPLIQGNNSQAGGTRRAPASATTQLAWQAGPDTQALLAADWLPGFGALPRIAWQQRFGDWQTAVEWRFHERRLGVALQWRGLQLRVGADRLDGAARSRELMLAYTWSQ